MINSRAYREFLIDAFSPLLTGTPSVKSVETAPFSVAEDIEGLYDRFKSATPTCFIGRFTVDFTPVTDAASTQPCRLNSTSSIPVAVAFLERNNRENRDDLADAYYQRVVEIGAGLRVPNDANPEGERASFLALRTSRFFESPELSVAFFDFGMQVFSVNRANQ